jgi:hypothetical protein
MPLTATFTEEQYSQVIQRIDKMVPTELVSASSVAILIRRGPQLGMLGSGTLFRIAEECFVITAAHVMKSGEGKNLCLAPNLCGPGDIVPFEGDAMCDERDTFDVAAVHLKPHVAEKIDPRRFLRLGNVSFVEDFTDGLFIVFGYPEMMFSHEKGNLKIVLFHHGGPVYCGDTSGLENYDPHVNLLVDADINETRGVDGKPIEFRYSQGLSAQFPTELKGISGGSVWQIMWNPRDIRDNAKNARIVAVETATYQKSRCIKATRWKVVVQMLRLAMPKLQPAIDMWRQA